MAIYTHACHRQHATPRDTSVLGFEPHQRYRTTARQTSLQSIAAEDCDGVSTLSAEAAIPEGNPRPPTGPLSVPAWAGGGEVAGELEGDK
jgi:hypothetical protein